ncbi:unnamed protein product [Tetraodon nigroviridis]|uniref:(spotted green pufferfish) hypothetical protein n=1 Tax=Tetraodon nigroviridis TaxID=99883 RepID=Q4T6W8_TETNG|nr:unnamed protein product [Tetraodon nigroviridis]
MERPKDEKSQEESECHHDNSNGVNNSRRKTVCPAAGEHPLQYNYTFWYSRRTPSRPASSQSYEQNIRQIGTVASVEQFWRFYSHLIRPGDLSGHSDFHLFKEGIKPMWETSPTAAAGSGSSAAERPGQSLLGEHHPGHAGGAVHGGGGDLRRRGLHTLPGGHPVHLEQNLQRPNDHVQD